MMLTYGQPPGSDMHETITIGERGTVSRIHNSREGWTISVSRPMIDVTQLGTPIHFFSSGPDEIELELQVTDAGIACRLMDLGYDGNGMSRHPAVESSMGGSCYRVRLGITMGEAAQITQHDMHPLEVLLGTDSVTVRAVPVDLATLLKELELDAPEEGP